MNGTFYSLFFNMIRISTDPLSLQQGGTVTSRVYENFLTCELRGKISHCCNLFCGTTYELGRGVAKMLVARKFKKWGGGVQIFTFKRKIE